MGAAATAAKTSRVTGRVWAWVAGSAGAVAAALLLPAAWVGAAHQQPSEQLVKLGYKFEGAAGCNAAKCHGSPTANPAPKPAGNEFNTWNKDDAHAKAYKSLEATNKDTGELTKTIMKGMNQTGAATASPLCTNCHALEAPAGQQMGNFNVKEGVTCGACHGPYEKWEKPHNQPGGADGLRKQVGYAVLKAEEMPYHTGSKEHQDLLKQFGLYDTRPILARAEKCVSCHLSIDAKLIEAGHPQPIFELAYYTDLEHPHWREPGGYWATKVWAAGQVVCLRDAMLQLAERAGTAGVSPKLVKDAYNQALGHLMVIRPLAGTGAAGTALDAAAKDLQAAQADNAKLATAAKAAAETASKMLSGVAAMKPAEGNTAAVLTALAKDNNVATAAGMRGAQQQSLALASLVSSFKKGKGNIAGIEAVEQLIGDKLLALVGDEASFKPADYSKNLAEVAGKLLPMLPSGAGVPDPIDLK